MNTITSSIEMKTKKVKDYISVVENAAELFELYTANIQLEILKKNLFKKIGSGYDDAEIMREIDLIYKLQELCRLRV
ncbi:MAG: hypothetical protein ABI863_21665 [Ginsengibacter sp.]